MAEGSATEDCMNGGSKILQNIKSCICPEQIQIFITFLPTPPFLHVNDLLCIYIILDNINNREIIESL